MAAKFDLKRSGKQFMFNLRAVNGRVILTSERYKSKASALNGIKSVRKNGKKVAQFDERTSRRGDPYFALRGGNREVIGTSEMYSSRQSMRIGIASVKKNAGRAALNDLT